MLSPSESSTFRVVDVPGDMPIASGLIADRIGDVISALHDINIQYHHVMAIRYRPRDVIEAQGIDAMGDTVC